MWRKRLSMYGLLQAWLVTVIVIVGVGAVVASGAQARNMALVAAMAAISLLCSFYVRKRDNV